MNVRLQAVKVPTHLHSELPKLARVLVLHQERGGSQLLNVHLEGLICNVVLGNLGSVLVDLVCQLFWRGATVLAVVPTRGQLLINTWPKSSWKQSIMMITGGCRQASAPQLSLARPSDYITTCEMPSSNVCVSLTMCNHLLLLASHCYLKAPSERGLMQDHGKQSGTDLMPKSSLGPPGL